MNDIEIRQLNPKSLSEVRSFCRLNWKTFVELDDAKEKNNDEINDIALNSQKVFLKKDSAFVCIVAINEKEIIGTHFLDKKTDHGGRPILHINNLHVSESWRGKGIGKKMKLFAEKIARDNGRVAITTTVDTHNLGIIKLNENLGYKTTRLTLRKDL